MRSVWVLWDTNYWDGDDNCQAGHDYIVDAYEYEEQAQIACEAHGGQPHGYYIKELKVKGVEEIL